MQQQHETYENLFSSFVKGGGLKNNDQFDSWNHDFTLNFFQHNATNTNSITIGHLRPFMNYTFTIITKSGDAQTAARMSLPISGIFTTKESVPGSLATFEAIDVKPSKITFRSVFASKRIL